jgi:hypothetical protein
MAIIQFNAKDILMSTVLEGGKWYGCKVTAIAGPTVSNAGDSFNYVVDFTLDDKTDVPGKVVPGRYNSKMIGKMIPLVSAIRGAKVEPKSFALDTDEILGKDVDVKMAVEIYEGNPKNEPAEFAPYGKGTDQKSPF